MTQGKSSIEPAQVAMLVQGTEVYGIGMVVKTYVTNWPETMVIGLNRGPLWDWLEKKGGRIKFVEGLSGFSARHSLRAIMSSPYRLYQARRDGRRIHQQLAGEGIRIIHTHRLAQQLVAGSMRRYGYRSVWQIHNNSSPNRMLGMSQKLNHSLARWGADLILPVSDFIAKDWRDSGVPTVTVRNAVQPLISEPSEVPSTGPLRCLVAGRLQASKGHHVAIEAVQLATLEGCEVQLDIYGGPLESNLYADQLRQQIKAADLDGKVRLMGFCEDLRERQRSYHVGFQCRIDPEPCSVWVCETLVDGLPLLASATGGTPELIEDGVSGFLYPAGSANELATRLVELCRDRAKLHSMRLAAFARGNKSFVTQRFLEETLAAYQIAVDPISSTA